MSKVDRHYLNMKRIPANTLFIDEQRLNTFKGKLSQLVMYMDMVVVTNGFSSGDPWRFRVIKCRWAPVDDKSNMSRYQFKKFLKKIHMIRHAKISPINDEVNTVNHA